MEDIILNILTKETKMPIIENAKAEQIFLVLGMRDDQVLFAVVVADDSNRAKEIFCERHEDYTVLSASSLQEMNEAVMVLTFVQNGKDITDPTFPMAVYRDNKYDADVSQFGL
jgi:hypothetical protein